MKTPTLRLFLLIICVCLLLDGCSQKSAHPFQDDIAAFRAADKDSFPPPNAILFVGSSSFTKWKDVQDYFPGYKSINRGFGGSGLNDLIRYAQDIIIPYHPKQVVIYCGENDVAGAGGSVTATDVFQRFTELFNIIRNKLPDANIVYISMKPSPSREKFRRIFEDGNIMIRQFLSSYPETVYVDVYHAMLNPDGKPKPEIFESDSLHMNAKGYAIWKKEIEPVLIK